MEKTNDELQSQQFRILSVMDIKYLPGRPVSFVIPDIVDQILTREPTYMYSVRLYCRVLTLTQKCEF
jgi:hypothetical protein